MSRRIYLDYASTTPLDKRVLKKMLPFLKGNFANPSSLYREGVEMKKAVETARKEIATLLKAHADEIIITSSGTEANNLALRGLIGKADLKIGPPHIITTTIEHASILEVCKVLETEGVEVTYLPVDENGIVSPESVQKAIKPNTLLVSVIYANNEIGTIEPVREIAKVIRKFKKEGQHIYFHIDACQAANYCDLSVEVLGIDMMTLDASKMYGPKGVGLLYKKRSVELTPLIVGGGQESALRAGTENVAGIIGMAEALKIAGATKAKESARLVVLRERTISEILRLIPGATLNGDADSRLPNNINICFPGIDAEFLVFQLDAKGISCSSVTSCKNLTEDSSSYVVEALGKADCAKSSLRITMGRFTTSGEMNYFLKTLRKILEKK